MQNATTLVAGSDLEKKLAEATSNEPWGASGVPLEPEPSWDREPIRRPFGGRLTLSLSLAPILTRHAER